MTRPTRAALKVAPPRADQQLYLIVWGKYVKIGCSADPIDRLTRVTERGSRPPRQNGQPELVGTAYGSFGAEAWLHAALASHRAHGEWFHLRGPVAELVAAATARGLEEWIPRPPRNRRTEPAPLDVRGMPGRTRYALVAARGGDTDTAWRHLVALPTIGAGELAADPFPRRLVAPIRAHCGTAGRMLVGEFDPTSSRACVRCARSVLR